MEYSEKLKDPRWQKKRLEIFERDKWTCQFCEDTKESLHVHHVVYKKGCDPWEYANEGLITICESCHESEKENRYKEEKLLLEVLRKSLLSCLDINWIACDLSTLIGQKAKVNRAFLNLFHKFMVKFRNG